MQQIIHAFDAAILGVVEGLTEFLPVSSTGHLILTSHWLGLGYGAGVSAFEIVIQSGALLAVIGLYWSSIRSMALGLGGKDKAGLELFKQLIVGFLPAAVVGLAAGSAIKRELFGAWPVALALAAGGLAMILVERYHLGRRDKTPGEAAQASSGGRELSEMTLQAAFLIGCAQCLAMWPGTSRSMVTILAALLLGFSPRAAAKFSFLLALPTLGAATAHDFLKDGRAILEVTRWSGLLIGFGVSFVVAWLAVKGFVAYLTRHGMAVFGWYRIVLAAVVALALLSQVTVSGVVQPLAGGQGAEVAIQARDGKVYPLYDNPLKAELTELQGQGVKASGSLVEAEGRQYLKVFSYLPLTKKTKTLSPKQASGQ